jgi:hypothetical protein
METITDANTMVHDGHGSAPHTAVDLIVIAAQSRRQVVWGRPLVGRSRQQRFQERVREAACGVGDGWRAGDRA